MAKAPRRRSNASVSGMASLSSTFPGTASGGGGRRFIVGFRSSELGKTKEMSAALSNLVGVRSLAVASDFTDRAMNMGAVSSSEGIVLEKFGLAVVTLDEGGAGAMRAASAGDSAVEFVVADEMRYAIGVSLDYVRGLRDATSMILGESRHDEEGGETWPVEPEGPAAMASEAATGSTWGINAVRANSSPHKGQGVRVAILDTGLDLGHPDFAGRSITSKSFNEQAVQDLNGHGTHCTGTACGPAMLPGEARYGVASRAEIYIGKVLRNQDGGWDTEIVAGIYWAVSNGCKVISMSLGGASPPNPVYERAGSVALSSGSLVIAAAGNNAQRPGNVGRVEAPANSKSILAVAAIDRNRRIASFSARSAPHGGGNVNISGPGVSVFSALSRSVNPSGRGFMSGTSQATPHVAGCAALWCGATGATGVELYHKLATEALALNIPAVDCGVGLVQAPQV